jgi:formate dehydrogenase major subunit
MGWIDPCEQLNAEFPLHLNNGRVLEHFQVGTMTYKVPGLREITPDTFLEVSPELAAERNLQDGMLMEVRSRVGWVRVRVLVTDRVQGNQMYMPVNTHDFPVNRLTPSDTDRATHTPAYKEVTVEMRPLQQEESPLPRRNFRYGHPTPQNGVEVERKWNRPDYRLPGSEPLVKIKTEKAEK